MMYWDALPRNLLRRLADLFYRMAPARANVVGLESRQLHFLQGKHVCLGDIQYVHVIPQAAAVVRGIVRAVDFKVFPPARSRLQQQGNDVRFWIVSFAPISLTSTGIEVSEYNHAPAIGRSVPLQDLFKDEFAFAVRIHWLFNVLFRNGNYLGRSVDSRRRGKNEFVDAVPPKSFEHRYSRSDVGIEKRPRVDHRLGNQRLRGKVEQRIKLRVNEQAFERVPVGYVKSVQGRALRNGLKVSGRQIIHHLDGESSGQKLGTAGRAHVPSTTCYQDAVH